ncbi:MAG: 2-oxoacid:acceptor oxidoreductase subunit alpha [Planctomycetes bacterium]|nr:2-oxoacid:acceptor oxidoreductase subunit alpha [Planctomycetota bacterium]
MPTHVSAPTGPAEAGHDTGRIPLHGLVELAEHTLEVVSDAGEGAQKCGQGFGALSARMGNGSWTVEIIPAEIQPPPRTPGSASGVRIRIGTREVTNWGDAAGLVIAFNEQVLLSRHRLDALADDAVILLEKRWGESDDPAVLAEWKAALEELSSKPYRIVLVPLEEQTLTVVDNPLHGKNMFALGVLCRIYDRDLDRAREQILRQFKKKSRDVQQANVRLLELGASWAKENLDFQIRVPPGPEKGPMVVMNGNEAVGMGAIASGMELCAMYPITPATSVSHYLGDVFERFGGIVHQAEDEIAAAGVAVGASFAGKVAFTVTSGPGLALKTEFLGLAVMTETPLVVVDVQRGGPSTGLPTKVEQADLLAVLFGQPGDAPKVVLAPATIEECFHCMITARRLAEALRAVVVVLTDANLATGVTPFPRPVPQPDWQATAPDGAPVAQGGKPYQWDPETGLSTRFVPGQPGGMFTATGLCHDEKSAVTYAPHVHQKGCTMRSRKLAALQSTLQPPDVVGPDSGDLLVVGWGSTKGAIEEACERARAEGLSVSSTHLTFLSPLQPGLRAIFERFRRVMTVEINYSDRVGDPFITSENRRMGQLAWLLRAQLLVDVDCWTRVMGEPLRPGQILAGIRAKFGKGADS